MPRSLRRALGPLALTFAVTAGLGSGCASVDAKSLDAVDESPFLDASRPPESLLDASRSDAQSRADAAVVLNGLCGAVGFCGGRAPDDPLACAGFDGGGPPPDAGSDGPREAAPPDSGGRADSGGGADSGDTGDGSDAAVSPPDGAAHPDAAVPADGAADGGSLDSGPVDSGAADASDAAEEGGVARGDGSPGARPAAPPGAGGPSDTGSPLPVIPLPAPVDAGPVGPLFACQVGGDDYGNAVHRCGPSGQGATGAPCASSGDCHAGLACVGVLGAGQCLPYCCDPGTTCPGGGDGGRQTYCGNRPLLEGVRRQAPLQVPVCVPAEECRLLEDPYPCSGTGCACGSDMACAVVREDGTTACVTPGKGKVGEACPCAAGYYCSEGTSQCSKLCKTTGEGGECAPGRCAATGGLPDGFGLCVGVAPELQ